MAVGDQSDVLARLKAVLPPWFSSPTPVLDAVLSGYAWAGSFVYGLYAYAKQQTRMKTATDGWLDMFAGDFFGSSLIRAAGQTDASFRARIIANLFRERATRNAIIRVLQDLTGRTPIVFEAERPADTGAWNNPAILCYGRGIPTSYALQFDGVDDYISTPLAISQNNASIECWIRNPLIATGAFILRSDANVRTYLNLGSPGVLTYTKGNPAVQIGNAPINATDPHHVVMTWRLDTGVLKASFYVDGIAIATDVVFTDSTPGTYLTLGGFNTSGTQNAAVVMDAVRVYNRTLSAAEVAQRYLGSYASEANLLAFYPFGEGIGNVAADNSGNGNTATLTNGPAWVPGIAPTPYYAATQLGPYVGDYGDLNMPLQALVTAFRPTLTGIPYVNGYGQPAGGYAVASRAEYASLSSIQGAVADADIYAAVDSVRPLDSKIWVRITS